jgi:hypothetical protein
VSPKIQPKHAILPFPCSCQALSLFSAKSIWSPQVQASHDECVLGEAVSNLLSGIEDAFKSKESLESTQLERERYVTALTALLRFLERVDSKHANYIGVLLDAIADLNTGARHPLLVPIKMKARPISSQIRRARDEVVYALNVLIDLEKRKHPRGAPKIVAKKILKDFPAIEHLAGPKSRNRPSKSDMINTILEWRKSAGRKKRSAAAAKFNACRGIFEMLDWTNRRESAHDVLARAEKVGVFVAHSNTL